MSPRRRLVRRRRRALVVAALLSAAAMALYLIVPRAVHGSEDEQSRVRASGCPSSGGRSIARAATASSAAGRRDAGARRCRGRVREFMTQDCPLSTAMRTRAFPARTA